MPRDLTQRSVGRLLIGAQVGFTLLSMGLAAYWTEWWMWLLALWCLGNLVLSYTALKRGNK